jgi:hypothetical protein
VLETEATRGANEFMSLSTHCSVRSVSKTICVRKRKCRERVFFIQTKICVIDTNLFMLQHGVPPWIVRACSHCPSHGGVTTRLVFTHVLAS